MAARKIHCHRRALVVLLSDLVVLLSDVDACCTAAHKIHRHRRAHHGGNRCGLLLRASTVDVPRAKTNATVRDANSLLAVVIIFQICQNVTERRSLPDRRVVDRRGPFLRFRDHVFKPGDSSRFGAGK